MERRPLRPPDRAGRRRPRAAAAPEAGVAAGRRSSFYSICGGTLFLVACSKAYAMRMSVGSLQGMPVKLTPNGDGFALNDSGNGGVGAFGTNAKGTVTVG